MKKIMVLFATFFMLLGVSSAHAVPDVNKYWDTLPDYTLPDGVTPLDPDDDTDSYMCWAAAASNVLRYTGWGFGNNDPLYYPEYDIYHEFLSAFPNSGGYGYTAYEWFFQEHHPSLDYSNYYVQINRDHNDPDYILENLKRLVSDIYENDSYRGNYGVYLSITNGFGGHALSVWGYTRSVQEGQLKHFISVTDSDDYLDGPTSYEIEKKYSVLSDTDLWYLKNYAGHEYSAYMRRLDALAPRFMSIHDFNSLSLIKPIPNTNLTPYYALIGQPPDGPGIDPIPEPTTMLLFGSGLIGLAGLRRKFKKG